MGDWTYLRTYIWACPMEQRRAALGVLRPDAGPGEVLAMAEAYAEEQVHVGYVHDLADELISAAPGASFVMWADPAWALPGELRAFTPALGDFAGECTAAGEVIIGLDEVLQILTRARSRRGARSGLHKAMAGPWMEDWAGHPDPVLHPRRARCRRLWARITGWHGG